MRLPVTLIRDALRPSVLAQEEVVARCQAVACHVYAAPPWKMKGIRTGCWSHQSKTKKKKKKKKKKKELCGIYTQRKEVEVRQERLLRKVECECADIERTPNRLLEVTWPAGWLRRAGKASQPASQPASRRDSQLGQPTWGVSLRPQGPQERRAVRTERDRGMQDGCAGDGEKMRGNREREGVGTSRGPEGTLPCGVVVRQREKTEKVGAARRDLVCRAACDSARNERIGQQHTAKRVRRKCCIYTYTVIQKSRHFFRYLVTVVLKSDWKSCVYVLR
ncbi:hypothetical protein G5I_00102 [Acromyrmex echinatior]|uniref:Uncharacterized protein n=1 Tax=Acromyrmex echinatior TaxID=103372 RepID=F4W3Z9_ACREC|nr:hypothetical protein G5I_00102 [Acromyrmex echinatior]